MYLKQEYILPLLLKESSIGRNLSKVAADYKWILYWLKKVREFPPLDK
jgi:hypothetical protein